MNLLFLSVTSTLLCIAVAVALKYLSILRWIGGDAYVLSKRKKHFSILEVLDLFKNVKPFPISCQKGWKIHSYGHGHRIWFTFLTFPHHTNAPSIKVYGVFDCVRSSSQALLHVLKDIGQTCDWKPGVISSSQTHGNQTSHQIPSSSRSLPSRPVQVDCVKEEKLSHSESKFTLEYQDPWITENVVETVSIEYKRFWHREDNGICWLLQMNEKLQTSEFYLIQPVAEVDQCLVSVVTWSRANQDPSLLVANPSVLLSALQEYMALRRLQKTPLMTLTLPAQQDLFSSDAESTDSSPAMREKAEANGSHQQQSETPLLRKVKDFISGNGGKTDDGGSVRYSKVVLKRYDSILKYGHGDDNSNVGGGDGNITKVTSPSGGEKGFTPLFSSEARAEGAGESSSRQQQGRRVMNSTDNAKLKRSVSDGVALKQSRRMTREIADAQEGVEGSDLDGVGEEEDEVTDTDGEESEEIDENEAEDGDSISPADLRIVGFKTLSNQCAAEVLAEAMRASTINLELSPEQQAESSGGWQFSTFEKNIVILKKIPQNGSTVQSYIGKGFVLAPPKTVWDAVRNPRTRFTYDDTIKKVDIIETVERTLKIVYFYHESQQFLVKESCDMCVLHGERQDGEKLVLTYSSIEHDKCPTTQGITRAKFLPSGWIIEPARQDNKVYSIVTYLMQIDFGGTPGNWSTLPFQDMISRYPLSIADLQQYLKPALQMLRRKSLN